ncbi:hypothetical protein SAMN04488518_106336 [Pseudovibrio ascidiaceicola]|uniref:Uncharacterized protein n=1 Tax=Pseudovibrio ascidiaceicola TaxID=285279 RepID=A0A1I4APV4_9HYPH|nr:hypothetical protein [Pseudovibrio ascidiaceicola]SFK58394.1 hypothetical protein SAMN04488518_106336 [Pseudovibrio ascidiaceicola]
MGKKKLNRVREGVCQLTRRQGKFVDSHLIPKALTKADGLGPGLLQMEYGRKARCASSWYDPQLVTREGEDILAAYDDWAISELRKHKLVWSGWGAQVSLLGSPSEREAVTVRVLKGGDWKKLRLFFLSILWRAAATKRPEFHEVSLPIEDLEKLRLMVASANPNPLSFYPLSLMQLSTLGVKHNHSPLAMNKIVPNPKMGSELRVEPIFRFYFDGLIIHFSRLPQQECSEEGLGALRVGGDEDELIVTTLPWDSSAQQLNLGIVKRETELGRPFF